MKIYISGPITGLPNGNREAFYKTEERLLSIGHIPVNPYKLNPEEDHGNWTKCLRNDIKHLMDCDYICMLPGWEKSKGATLEKEIADRVGISEYK